MTISSMRFYNKWNEILQCMKPEDVPSKNSLRDTLYHKLEGKTKLMAHDPRRYDAAEEGTPDWSPDRTYDNLLRMVETSDRQESRETSLTGT